MALTNDQMTHALKQSAGNVTAAARGLGVTRGWLYRRIEKSPALQAVLQDEREALVDMAESALRKQVLEGDMAAIIWTLKANPAAKERGWGERREVTGSDGGDLRIVMSWGDAQED